MNDAPQAKPVDAKRISIAFASSNRRKLAELERAFSDLPIQLIPATDLLPDFGAGFDEGSSIEQSATQKAVRCAKATHLVSIADDWGLEIEALSGRPGVRSERFAGEGATDAENNAAVLSALDEVDDPDRKAGFRCAMVLASPWAQGDVVVVEGRCDGAIARQARGTGGFGYDSLLIVDGYDRTVAELDEDERNDVSSRARALKSMRPHLEKMIDGWRGVVARVLKEGDRG